MQKQFQIFIKNLLADKYDILPDSHIQLNFDAESIEEILKTINLAFLILLEGSSNPRFSEAKQFLHNLKSNKKYKQIVEFYLIGTALIEQEIDKYCERDLSFNDKLEQLNRLSYDTHNYEQIVESFWEIFFPEGKDLLDSDKRQLKVDNLREMRKIDVLEKNPEPIANPAKEILFTSNILLTVPLDFNNLENGKIPKNIKLHLKNVKNEKQKYWYDHPIPIGVSPEKNEVLYGLTGLSQMLQFEKERGNAKPNDNLNCLLSVSVTHEGLHEIAKEYLSFELNESDSVSGLNVYIFSENETKQLIDNVLIPVAREFLNADENQIDNLKTVFGVDGEYGRHYSFLKAVAAVWQVFVDEKIKGTFKIDLDQVYPNEALVEQSGASVFEHFSTPLWGAKGRDAHGNNIDLSMIAGALVNETDIEKSLYYPDVPFPTNNEINPDEHLFFSKLPQALSTEAEMMEKYNSESLDGENSVISRVHVTGGTNGILIKALRYYRPFTPTFIGRAEDQAYLMSVLFEGANYPRYLHKPGLIMRHDKHSFAVDAIKAAETGKIIGDYIRILLFSNYAKILPWSVKRVKSELNPFTGCFISNIPYTIVYLRFVLLINYLFSRADEKNKNKAINLMLEGIPRLLSIVKMIEDKNLLEQYISEKKGWNLFYNILDCAENKIKSQNDRMLEIQKTAQEIFLSSKIL